MDSSDLDHYYLLPITNNSEQQFEGRSQLVKDLISKILQPSEKRLKCKQILEHNWLKNFNYSHHPIKISVVKNFKSSSKLKIIGLSYLATQLDSNEIQEQSKIFKQYDKDRDGHLSLIQLSKLFDESGINMDCTLEDISQYLDVMNTSKNGKITYNQFLAATIKKEVYSDPLKLKMIFNFLDKSKTGMVAYQDVNSIQQNIQISKEQWQNIVKSALGQSKDTLNFQQLSKCIVL